LVVNLLSFVRKGVIIMETFFEILREVMKGMVRETTAYFFRKNVLEDKKTTLRRHKLKGGSQKTK
jgi:hypothetical protein